ncbi:hypothetical protein EUX98_g8168 [Antrodiella citrinella]|uniref:Uncharacterized protein n=1 Tax=Antrodiella citrinella TaxID=2447956 RepID=A0A4S4MAQ0_9APHY|nr:hypothetical protein EUX98_g8168 [Antrodiella citrinella]
MLRSRPILDSSPIDVPSRVPSSPRRAQPAPSSLMALPTPPRTKHSRKRKRSISRSRDTARRGRVTDSDDEVDNDDTAQDATAGRSSGALHVGHKRRKTLRLDTLAAELSGQTTAAAAEEAFWTGEAPHPVTAPDAASAKSSNKATAKAKAPQASATRGPSRSPTRSPSSSPPARLLRRNRTGLASPPPSRRQAASVVALPITPPPLPRTPRGGRSIKKRLFPERDSPNNPFLVPQDSPEALSSPEVEATTPIPLPYVEKPTITYVFRGVKAEFRNPLYDPSHPSGVPSPKSDDPSSLPIHDREYSPTPYCPPKLLFPEARKRNHARARKSKPESGPHDSGKDEDNAPVAGPSTPRRPSVPKVKAQVLARSRSPKSEWDSSDDEDAPPPARRGRQAGGVKPKFPVDVLPAHQEVTAEEEDKDEEEVKQVIKQMPKKDIKRIAKIAPLLLDATGAKR